MAPPREDSPPAEFDVYIRRLRQTDEVQMSDLAAYIGDEILDQTRKDDGSLWVSFLDAFITSIRRVVAQTPGGDNVLEEVGIRLEDTKLGVQ